MYPLGSKSWEPPVVWYRPKVEVPLAATEKARLLGRAYGPMMVSLPGAPMPKGRKSPNLASASVTRHLVPSGRGPRQGPCAAGSAEVPRIVPGAALSWPSGECSALQSLYRLLITVLT